MPLNVVSSRARLEPLRLELSADELAVLAGRLGIADRLDAIGPVTDVAAERMRVAEETLRQRGLLATGAHGVTQLDRVVGALLGTCAFPSLRLILGQSGAAGSFRWRVDYRAEMAVEHRTTPDGLHVFSGFGSALALVEHLSAVVGATDQPRPDGELVTLTQASIDAARATAASEGPAEAAGLLREAGVAADVARSLAVALCELDAMTHIAALGLDDVRGVTLLRASTGFWGFIQPDPEIDELHAAPLAGAEVRALITALVALGR